MDLRTAQMLLALYLPSKDALESAILPGKLLFINQQTDGALPDGYKEIESHAYLIPELFRHHLHLTTISQENTLLSLLTQQPQLTAWPSCGDGITLRPTWNGVIELRCLYGPRLCEIENKGFPISAS